MNKGSKILSLLMSLVLILGLSPTPAFALSEISLATMSTMLTTQSAAHTQAEAATYKVVFKANGGKGMMKAQAIKRGKKTALRANAFTRSGYTFAGWNTKANGTGKSYANKAKVKNLAKTGKTVKLYAQWKKTASYKISTPRYTLTLPKSWRGKVEWDTSTETQYKNGQTFKAYKTNFYLKGHKGDMKYWLLTIGGQRIGYYPFDTTMASGATMRFIDLTQGNLNVFARAADVPKRISWSHQGINGGFTFPASVADQRAMLKLVAGDTISFADAAKTDDGGAAAEYMKKQFKSLKARS